MKVLVTGGAGYIGSVTTALLLEAGHEVTVMDNLSHGHRDAVPDGVQFIQADVREIGGVLHASSGIEAVVHLGAYIAAGESMAHPEMYWQNNTVSTLDMLDGMRALGIHKLIFASTAAVYGNPAQVPITEDAPTTPTSTYGMTKLAMDMAITSEAWAYDLAAMSIRFFNVAGAYGPAGERHPEETHIIPLALQVAAGRREYFALYGDDYPTPDGTCVRDYVHVVDLARAIQLGLEKVEPGKHAIYNLGNGNGFSNREVIAAVEKVTGKTLPVRIEPRRAGDPAILVASSDKIRKELGWEPTHPGLEQMIADVWALF